MNSSLFRLTVLLIPLLLLVFIADNAVSTYRLQSVLNLVSTTEMEMNDYKDTVTLKPIENTNCATAGMLSRQYCLGDLDSYVSGVLAPNSEKLRVSLEVNSYKVNQFRTFPFGGEFKKPLLAYDKHLQAWIDVLGRRQSCTTTNCVLELDSEPNDIASTFRIAEELFLQLKPRLDLFELGKQIDSIFEP